MSYSNDALNIEHLIRLSMLALQRVQK